MNIQEKAARKKKWRSPATTPHTTGLSVWFTPARNTVSAISRHTHRFLWMVVRSLWDWKQNVDVRWKSIWNFMVEEEKAISVL